MFDSTQTSEIDNPIVTPENLKSKVKSEPKFYGIAIKYPLHPLLDKAAYDGYVYADTISDVLKTAKDEVKNIKIGQFVNNVKKGIPLDKLAYVGEYTAKEWFAFRSQGLSVYLLRLDKPVIDSKGENVKGHSALVIDIDNATPEKITTALQNPFVKKHGSIIEKSFSYTAQKPNHHIFIFLSREVNHEELSIISDIIQFEHNLKVVQPEGKSKLRVWFAPIVPDAVTFNGTATPLDVDKFLSDHAIAVERLKSSLKTVTGVDSTKATLETVDTDSIGVKARVNDRLARDLVYNPALAEFENTTPGLTENQRNNLFQEILDRHFLETIGTTLKSVYGLVFEGVGSTHAHGSDGYNYLSCFQSNNPFPDDHDLGKNSSRGLDSAEWALVQNENDNTLFIKLFLRGGDTSYDLLELYKEVCDPDNDMRGKNFSGLVNGLLELLSLEPFEWSKGVVEASKFLENIAFVASGGGGKTPFYHKVTNRRYTAENLNRRFTPNAIKERPKASQIVLSKPENLFDDVIYAPGKPKRLENTDCQAGVFETSEGTHLYNLFNPFYHPGYTTNEEPTQFLDHLKLLYGDDHIHLVQWMAYTLQRPEIKIPYAVVLEGDEGIGKNLILWLFDLAIKSQVGKVKLSDFAGDFDDCKFGKKVILIDELEYHKKFEERAKANIHNYNQTAFTRKGLAATEIYDVINYAFTTNHRDCLPLNSPDGENISRRFLILSTDVNVSNTPSIGKKTGYHSKLANYMINNLDGILAYFYHIDRIKDFELGRAPHTKGYDVFYQNGLSLNQRIVNNALDCLKFSDIVSSQTLFDMACYDDISFEMMSDLKDLKWAKITKILEEKTFGFKPMSSRLPVGNTKKHTCYIRKSVIEKDARKAYKEFYTAVEAERASKQF